ncbi:spermine oxidase [Anoplophora glabripennis]|uniref:spermine oxidase n=1 Tax=Anoplophora glabripennis TaxID=217634 RepID=UPI0008755F11|nr:spermine oxidase [Anoplophora glabripennis]
MLNNNLLLIPILFLPVTNARYNPSILIIGAGPSGIAAATKLLKNNFTNLRIFEAENRIGGRIRSVKFGDSFIDLGAEWCHGEKDNIVYEMVNQYDVLMHTNLSYKLVYSNGKYIDDEVYQGLLDFAENIDASVTNEGTEKNCGNLESVGECFQKLFNASFSKKYNTEPQKLRVSLDSKDWLEHYTALYDSTFSLLDLSRKSDYKRCEGDLRLNWNGRGFKTILELMMQKFPDSSKQLPIDNKIFLKKEVTRISWKGNSTKVLVRCFDDTTVEVDHVIFTPSLGVLKASYKSLFEPSLPADKVAAIRNFGFGATFKVAFHFPKTWWNASELYGFVWSSDDERRIIADFPEGPIKNGKSWLTASVKFFQAENNPKVLIGFFAAEMVPELEKESDKVITDGCMYLFKTFLGANYTVLEPDAIIRSSWYNNRHFRGTYSYESVKGKTNGKRYPQMLGMPLEYENGTPAVLFAGEATHPYYFSTVHAAIETGYREADRLIGLYRQKV